ncbi:MAG: nucleoside deaminase [Nitriliruptoraceae bacterium]|nr:nucleoside deaminase [Nitriliruptoraceae bacterium]
MASTDVEHLRRCVALAERAGKQGDQPFGSVLVAGDGEVLQEASNTVRTDADITAHPELKLARWAARHLGARERSAATMFTSGEHCPMCATAHAYAGIGRLVFAFSSEQLAATTGRPGWQLSVRDLFERGGVPTVVEGPFPALADACRALHVGRDPSAET